MRAIYSVAYWAGMLWFAGYLFFAATRPENQSAGALVLAQIAVVAVAPCAVLWVGKRLVTGRWL